MKIIFNIVFSVLIIAYKTECQVVLTRQLLEQWFGNELTTSYWLDLTRRDIISIEKVTFNGLTLIEWLYLDYNQL